MAPQRQERHCGRRWQHGAARRPAGAARLPRSPPRLRRGRRRSDVTSANVTQARRCLHNILHGRRSAACTDQPSPLPQCHSGASAAWARARWTARRRPCAALPAAHDVLPLWPPANQLEPAHQPDRLDGSLLIGIYSAVIASILYAVAADSEASEREERRRRGAPLQLPLHEPHKNRL